jgi:hypothetical protein
MEDNKKLKRGLEEVSHLFLSCQDLPRDAKSAGEPQGDDGNRTCLPDHTARKEGVKEQLLAPSIKQSLCLLFSSRGLFAEKSFLACSLAIKLASRNFSVGLIETTTAVPNTFLLLRPFLTESLGTRNRPSLVTSLPDMSPTPPTPEPLEVIEIPVRPRKSIRAVFINRDLESEASLTLFDRLNSESDFLIINASSDVFRLKKMMSLMSPFFIVTSTVEPAELLSSYLLIKDFCGRMACTEVGLFIIEERHYLNAEGAFRIIAQMARRFLSTNVHFMATIPLEAGFSRSISTRKPLLWEMENTPASRSIRKVANRLIKRIRSPERNHQW